MPEYYPIGGTQAGVEISDSMGALHLGFIVCRASGYEKAAEMCPWLSGDLAVVFDSGIAEHEILADDDSDDYSDMTDELTPEDKTLDMLAATSGFCFLTSLVVSLPFWSPPPTSYLCKSKDHSRGRKNNRAVAGHSNGSSGGYRWRWFVRAQRTTSQLHA